MGDLFAPAYRANDPASVQAVNDWQNRVFNVNDVNIEQTRAPVAFNTGKPGGMLDPEALRVRAQGGPYDFGARRDAIAAQIAAQPRAAAPLATGVAAGLGANYVDPGPLLPNGVYLNDYLRHSATNPADYQKYGGDARPDEQWQNPPTTNWYNAVNSGVGIGG